MEADSDGSQGLSKVEMVEWMMRLEKAETMKGLRNHFREADRDNNGYVTLLEFAHTMAAVGEEEMQTKTKFPGIHGLISCVW